MVVDNSPVITRIIKNYLMGIGFTGENITLVNDGNTASMMLELQNFDLVTTGMRLKAYDGVDLLKQVRENSDEKIKSTPFIIISAERKEYFTEILNELGCNGYVQKPFTVTQLRDSINNIFNPVAATILAETVNTQTLSLDVTAAPSKLDPKFIKPFIESTIEALEQYMAQATPGEPMDTDTLLGDISSMIDLTDQKNAITLKIILSFPKSVACKIYEGIFGEVDMEQVCGVVQELGNIIAGIVKPKIADLSQEIYNLVHPGQTINVDNGNMLDFQLGLPVATMRDNHTVTLDIKDAPRFTIPFEIAQEKVCILIQFQKFEG